MICSIIYSASYHLLYHVGDEAILDKIDIIILNEEFERSFVDGLANSKTRGVQFRTTMPEDSELRRKVMPLMHEEQEETIEAM